MPAPILRHVSNLPGTVVTDVTLLAAVPTARAVVVSKLLVANYSSSASSFHLFVGGQGVAFSIPLAPGEVYTETGLVVLAGETVVVRQLTASTLAFHLFGEEVDN